MTLFAWHHGEVPVMVIGKRIENWTGTNGQWFRMIGKTSVVDGEVGMLPDDVEVMDFHDAPPCPTESTQVWRLCPPTKEPE